MWSGRKGGRRVGGGRTVCGGWERREKRMGSGGFGGYRVGGREGIGELYKNKSFDHIAIGECVR